jgi:hypothetical protein
VREVGGGRERGTRMKHMYVDAKMISVETVPGIRGGARRERSEGANSSMLYLIHFKKLCNAAMYHTQHNNKNK